MKALIHVIDDDADIRESIDYLLSSADFDVACYANAREFIDAPNTGQPGCLLLDLRMPDMNGLELQRLCAQRHQHKPVIVLTGHGDVDSCRSAMRQGAAEYLMKPVDDETLLRTVCDAVESNRRQQSLANHRASISARMALLSPREREVLEGLFKGGSNRVIAAKMMISPKTVELHRANLMRRMHADSFAGLIRMCTEVWMNAESTSADRSRSAAD